jgi:hypothetical protein
MEFPYDIIFLYFIFATIRDEGGNGNYQTKLVSTLIETQPYSKVHRVIV